MARCGYYRGDQSTGPGAQTADTGGKRHDLGSTGIHRSEDGRRDQLLPGRFRARVRRPFL